MRILLNKHRSKQSTNVNNSIPIDLVGRNRILPVDAMQTNINEVELYNEERQASNIIRLTCVVNPLCSNILFNNITEIVVDEGSDDCKSLNYMPLDEIDNGGESLVFKSKDMFNTAYKGVRDTQLSNEANKFKYFCGLDIFSNHILRSNTFKTVCKLSGGTSEDFNTISDYMRHTTGEIVSGYSDAYTGTPTPDIALHLYLADDILSFKETVSSRLIDTNGWFGFTNIGKFGTYNDDTNEQYDIYKVINNKKACDFVDMYPTRDLWYFTPKYNKSRKRIEKNWNYCLTYPSSSTTKVDFIREETNSLKVCMFDDVLTNSIGTSGLRIYSTCMHGLEVGDIVNIYNGNEVVIRNAQVADVDDDYIFTVYDNGVELSKKWKEISSLEMSNAMFEYSGKTYNIIGDKHRYAQGDGHKFPLLPNNKVSLDEDSLDISYKRVVEGEEMKYYIRIFSRIPNWKYTDVKPTEYEMYKEGSDLIYRNQIIDNEFENHVSKLAFSKNIYNDDISEIVFTDDIDISNLKDNLGRPLTNIYLSIFKNNQGYKEWYGIDKGNGVNLITNTEQVEYSHCFGKLTCGFRLSKESLWSDEYTNTLTINRVDNKLGLDIDSLNSRTSATTSPIDSDEIQYSFLDYTENGQSVRYNGDVNFYGDLCGYSEILLDEQIIQPIEFRFNTAQRELKQDDDASFPIFNTLVYEEITRDDYDDLTNASQPSFEVTENSINHVCQRKEGYVYNPHFEIPIKTFSDEITTQKPYYLTIKDINVGLDEIFTLEHHYLNEHDKFVLRVMSDNSMRFINCEVGELINDRKFKFTCNRKELSGFARETIIMYGSIIKGGEDIPNYAKLSTDGSCYYMWREIIQNGFDTEGKIEEYPFTNGALYVNKQVNLFVRRQDPNNYSNLRSNVYPYDNESNLISTTEENNYYQEEDITC